MNPNLLTLLPVYERKEEILSALKETQVLIVSGDTGCGKSTCLPYICYEAGYTKDNTNIVITQPRRIAAVSLAKYLSQACGVTLGKEVGYWIRFQHKIQKNTPIIYMTDGILLSILSQDPLLRKYKIVIIDEAHERSLRIDFLMGWIKTILPKRPDLKLIISSATIDTHIFTRAFKNAALIEIPVKRFNIDIRYKAVIELWKGYSIDSFIEGAIQATEEICNSGEKGDILIFLPTIDNVSECARRLLHRIKEPEVNIFTLHSHLPSQKQQEVFKKYKGRKIVVATNIAETSLTVPGIRFVIDSGLVRILRYEPTVSICRMPIEKISQASADQRAGRCGRVEDGVCIRLYSEGDYLSRPKFTQPEIVRTNISELILKLHYLNWKNIKHFPFIQQPKNDAIVDAYRQLQDLGAIDKRQKITPFGISIARLPLEPPVATMLLKAKNFGAVIPVMVITAALSVQEPLLSVETGNIADLKGLKDNDSDFITYLNVWKKLYSLRRKAKKNLYDIIDTFCDEYKLHPSRIKEWVEAFKHIRRICEEFKIFRKATTPQNSSYEAIHKSLLCGLVNGIATLKERGVYEGLAAKEIRIASSSVNARKDKKWLLLHEIIETDHIYALRSAVINPKWVEELFKERCSYNYREPWYDPASGKVMIYEEVSYKNLTLIHNRLKECHLVDRDLACKVFISQALVKGMAYEDYRFIQHNTKVLKDIFVAQNKLRRKLYRGEEALENFYREKVDIATRKELNLLIKEKGNDEFLFVKPENICYDFSQEELEDYWDKIKIGEYELEIKWKNEPYSEDDGATIMVPEKIALLIPSYYWEWYPPALRKKRSEIITQKLEYDLISKGINPDEFQRELIDKRNMRDCEWIEYVISFSKEKYNLNILDKEILLKDLPSYLWLRVVVVGEDGSEKVSFRPPFTYWKKEVSDSIIKAKKIPQKIVDFYLKNSESTDLWEKKELDKISIPQREERIAIFFYPALYKNGTNEEIAFFFSKNAALTSTFHTIKTLLEESFSEELAWEIEKMRISSLIEKKRERCGIKLQSQEIITHLLLNLILEMPPILPKNKKEYEKYLKTIKDNIRINLIKIPTLLNNFFDKYEYSTDFLNKKKNAYSYNNNEKILKELESSLEEYLNFFTKENCPAKYLLKIPEYLNVFPARVNYAFLNSQNYLKLMEEIHICREILEEATHINDYTISLLYWDLKKTIEDSMILLFSNGKQKAIRDSINREIKTKRLILSQAINKLEIE